MTDPDDRPACFGPFVTLELDPKGNISACCANQLYPVGHVSQDRLMDVWRGPRVNALREALWADDLHLGCHGCRWQLERGRENTPINVYESYSDRFEDNDYPRTMAFALSNTCNLECEMCNGDLSSKIRSRREHRPPLRSPYDDRFFTEMCEVVPHLEVARFLGGEPFLIREHHRLWDVMIAEGIDTACHVTTNGTTYDARVERALEHLPFSINVSLDGMDHDILRSIRIGVDPPTVFANIERFHAYTRERGTKFEFNFCLMRQNWQQLAAVLRYGERLGARVAVISVFDDGFNVHDLPIDELEHIVTTMDADTDDVLADLVENREVWLSEVAALHDLLERRRSDHDGGRLYVSTTAVSLSGLRP